MISLSLLIYRRFRRLSISIFSQIKFLYVLSISERIDAIRSYIYILKTSSKSVLSRLILTCRSTLIFSVREQSLQKILLISLLESYFHLRIVILIKLIRKIKAVVKKQIRNIIFLLERHVRNVQTLLFFGSDSGNQGLRSLRLTNRESILSI